MILIYESVGDVELFKFVIYKIPFIFGVDENNYNEKLNGYLYFEKYFYNTLTNETDDRYITHADIIDDIVPYDVKKKTREIGTDVIVGKTDCYLKDKNGNNPIRMWFSGASNSLTISDREYLKKMFHADKII